MKNVFSLLLIGLLLQGCAKKEPRIWEPEILINFKENSINSNLPDYSYAGYAYGEKQIPTIKGKVYNISDYGAIANDNLDDTDAINKAIKTAGENGGGIVLFSKGKFLVNTDTTVTNIVKINYSNIVLRGAGTTKNGTIIFSGSSTHQAEDNSPWLSPFVFHSGLNLQNTSNFFSVEDLPIHSKIEKDILKGETIVEVSSTNGLSVGDIVLLAIRNTSDDGNLMNDLMFPLKFEEFQKSYSEAGIQKAASFQWPVEIDKVIDETHIKLKQPVKRDVFIKYKPTISKMPMLKNIGIENFRFESAWNGNYKHHGNREMDYGWGAINLQRVSHGWIKNIHIHNFTQTTHLVNSRNVTIEDVYITGKIGHYSPKMYHSSDNLVQNITVDSEVTHGPSLEGCSFGNVYKNIKYKYPTPIDLHGMADKGFCPPMYNLFEDIENVEQIAGGAAPQNIPHSGEYNTFWNIGMQGWEDGEFQEIFYSWIWRNPKQFKNEMHIDCHKQYLRSNLVGVYSSNSNKKLSVEHGYNDREDDWIYIEGLNSSVAMVSLYNEQLIFRLNK